MAEGAAEGHQKVRVRIDDVLDRKASDRCAARRTVSPPMRGMHRARSIPKDWIIRTLVGEAISLSPVEHYFGNIKQMIDVTVGDYDRVDLADG